MRCFNFRRWVLDVSHLEHCWNCTPTLMELHSNTKPTIKYSHLAPQYDKGQEQWFENVELNYKLKKHCDKYCLTKVNVLQIQYMYY